MVALYTIKLDPAKLGEAALDRIIKAAGLKPKKAPNPFPDHPEHCDDSQSRTDLRNALLAAEARYRFDVDRRGEGRSLGGRKRIARAARKLKERIASDPSVEFYCLELEQLARAAEKPPPRPVELGSRSLSAFDNLVGDLMKAFEQCFGRKARFRKNAVDGGRFCRFAQQTIAELQLDEHSPRTIANAIDRVLHPETAQR
jgi:hypothetical protein